jgi:putative ABC transport system permease protein
VNSDSAPEKIGRKPKLAWILTMAWRDTRRTRAKLALFGFSVIFGVAALVAVNSLRANLEKEVDRQSRALLGADLEFRSSDPFDEATEVFIDSLEALDEANDIRLSTMAYFTKSDQTRLVSLRALEGGFPWYGELETRPPSLNLDPEQGRVAIIEESLKIQYDLEIGDVIRIGKSEFKVIGEVLRLPGESSFRNSFSPRILVPFAFLEETDLMGFGSRTTFRRRLVFENGVDTELESALKANEGQLRQNGIRYETAEEEKEDIGNMLNEMTSYLSLVGFVALLLGGVGIAGAVQVYLKEKSASMAILRCLGCSGLRAMMVFCVQIVAVGFAGCVVGAALGVATQAILPQIVKAFLPFDLPFEIVWPSLLEAFLFAWALTLLFALLPLLPTRNLSPLRAIRSSSGLSENRRDWLVWMAAAAIGALTLWFSILQTDDLKEAAGVFGGILVAIIALGGIGIGLRKTLKSLRPKSLPFVWKQGISNLYRPNNRTVSLIVMIGMGAFLIYTLYLCETSILKRGEINDQEDKPNTVFFDVQSDQVDTVKAIVDRRGVELKFHDPMVTMRLTHLRSRPVSQLRRNRDLEGWALSREYRSTYRSELRAHEPIVAGEFIPNANLDSDDPIPISVEERIVEALQLQLGDLITWDVQGLPIETVVTSIRKVDWRQMQPNFFVVFPSGILEEAPSNHILAAKAQGVEAITELQGEVVKTFPNISAINLSMVLESLKEIFDKVGFVVRFMASFTILTGLVALIATVLTSRYQRMKESVLLRSLGANTSQVRKIMAVEYFLVGGLGSAAGVLLSLGGAWAMTRFIFKIELYVPWGITFASIVLIGLLTLVTGMLNSIGIAKRPPIEALRYE